MSVRERSHVALQRPKYVWKKLNYQETQGSVMFVDDVRCIARFGLKKFGLPPHSMQTYLN